MCVHVPSPITMTYNYTEGRSETHVWAGEWMKGTRAKLSWKFNVLTFLGTHDHSICACTCRSVFTCEVDPSYVPGLLWSSWPPFQNMGYPSVGSGVFPYTCLVLVPQVTQHIATCQPLSAALDNGHVILCDMMADPWVSVPSLSRIQSPMDRDSRRT